MIDRDVLNMVDRELSNMETMSGVDNWFSTMEPLLTVWARGLATARAEIPQLQTAPPITRLIADRMTACVLIGYLTATLAAKKELSDTIPGIGEFMARTGNASVIYNDWLEGKMPARFYTSEFLGSVEGELPEDVARARTNRDKVEQADRAVIGRLKIAELLSAASAQAE